MDGYWEHPDAHRYGKVAGQYGAVTRAWLLTLHGPLPGRSGVAGEQKAVIRTFGDGTGWWMLPAEAGSPDTTPR